MSYNDWIWHNRKSRTHSRLLRRRGPQHVSGRTRHSWIYVLYGLVGLANFNATTIHHHGWNDTSHHHNVAVTFCVASELVEDTETVRPNSIRNRERPSTGTTGRSSTSELHPIQNTSVPPIILLKRMKHQPPKLETSLTLNQIMYRAGKRGLGGGIPGAIAGAFQVVSLMWLRTIINYQSRYGTTFAQALRTLLNEGGIARLYCGVTFALVQAPLARFVSTAANDGVESLLANLSWTQTWGPGRTTVVASIVVGFWRMLLMPIDTAKTVLQIDSVEGFRSLMRRVKAGRIGLLYSGAIANAISAVLGHYPWFYTYNVLSSSKVVQALVPLQLLRNAGIGVVSSVVSDTFVNVFRVIKTTKQSLGSKQNASYLETIRIIVAADGYKGLFGRGLRTRIYANALQSLVFTIVWRGLTDLWRRRTATTNDDATSI